MEDIKELILKIKQEFLKIGTRIKIIPFTPSSKLFRSNLLSISVEQDEKGEFFEVLISKDLVKSLKVVRINKESGHLILVAGYPYQYLCGTFDNSLYLNNLAAPRDKNKKQSAVNKVEESTTDLYTISEKSGLNFAFIKYIFNKMQSAGFYRNFN